MLITLAQKTSWLVIQFLNRCVFRFEIIGKENINKIKNGPIIIAANHKSFWDHFFIGSSLKFNSKLWPLRFIAGDWLFRNPFWMPLTKILGGFPANRGKGLEISLKTPLEILKNNGTVIFYPEGRIVREDDLLGEPKRGVGALALWSKAPVLPVAIKGSRGMSRRKNVKLIFGKPFYIQDFIPPHNPNPTEEDFNQAGQLIMNEVKKLYFSQ